MTNKSLQLYSQQTTADIDLMCKCGTGLHIPSDIQDDGKAVFFTCPLCLQSWSAQLLIQEADPPTITTLPTNVDIRYALDRLNQFSPEVDDTGNFKDKPRYSGARKIGG